MDHLDQLVKLEKEASDFGFRWETAQQILNQIEDECAEINDVLLSSNKITLQEEIGDLMHAVFSLCVFCQFDPQTTLANSITKFEKRFNEVKKIAELQGLASLNGYPFSVLMDYWNQAKKAVG